MSNAPFASACPVHTAVSPLSRSDSETHALATGLSTLAPVIGSPPMTPPLAGTYVLYASTTPFTSPVDAPFNESDGGT